MMPVHVKVCGITRLADARLACDLGAWALGFIFYPPSPRAISADKAAEIVSQVDERVHKVGVFVDEDRDAILATARRAGLTIAQLHGRESAAFARDLRPHFHQVWKALRVGAELPADDLAAFPDFPLLLDTYKKGVPGGTGETFDWSVAQEVAQQRRIILAGGLSPQNIQAAVSTVRPYAVDVSSGVESAPGRKDHGLLKDLFACLA